MEIPYVADDASAMSLERLGRTEDIQLSPDNRRIAIAGANEDKILILSIDTAAVWDGGPVRLGNSLELTCSDFQFPHGLFWVDDRTIIVANRNGHVTVIDVPELGVKARQAEICASLIIGTEPIDRVVTPGSVVAYPVFDDVHEIYVCNNYTHYVTRHLVDFTDAPRLLGSRVLLQNGLDIPDGIALGDKRKWIAVSNHNYHRVDLFRNNGGLNPTSPPDGRLTGCEYPHGLRFISDGRLLLLADAGAPHVHIYQCDDGDWSGDRKPVKSLRIMDDEAFRNGQTNPQEGGPKGIDICRDNRILVASCEHRPITFHRIDMAIAELCESLPGAFEPATPKVEPEPLKAVFLSEMEGVRQDGIAIQAALMETRSALTAQQEAHHALSQSHHDLSQTHHTLAQSHHDLAGTHHILVQQHQRLIDHPWREVVLPKCRRMFFSIWPMLTKGLSDKPK